MLWKWDDVYEYELVHVACWVLRLAFICASLCFWNGNSYLSPIESKLLCSQLVWVSSKHLAIWKQYFCDLEFVQVKIVWLLLMCAFGCLLAPLFHWLETQDENSEPWVHDSLACVNVTSLSTSLCFNPHHLTSHCQFYCCSAMCNWQDNVALEKNYSMGPTARMRLNSPPAHAVKANNHLDKSEVVGSEGCQAPPVTGKCSRHVFVVCLVVVVARSLLINTPGVLRKKVDNWWTDLGF